MYGLEKVATRARSNVRPMPDIAMSNLSASKSGSMLPKVIFTYSILTPSALPRVSSASMSKPSSWPDALRMLKTGVSIVVPTRNVPFLSTPSSRSGVALCAPAGMAASVQARARRAVRIFIVHSKSCHSYFFSLRRPAAVDHHRRAGNQRRRIGRQEQNRAGKILKLAKPAELDAGKRILAEDFILKEGPRHRRLDERGRQRVDADFVRGKLDRHRLGETFHCVLGRAIDRSRRAAHMAHLRRHVDDRA